MEKGKQKDFQKRELCYAITVIMVCICLILGAYGYIRYIRNCLMDQTISNVQTVTQQHQQAFDSFVKRDLERLHSYAEAFSKLDSKDAEKIRDKIDLFFDVGAFYSVVNMDTWEAYNSKSADTLQISEENREQFLNYEDRGVRDLYTSVYTQTPMFGYYERFTFQDGVDGLVQKGYEADKISEEFALSFYNGQGFAYIVNLDGDILMSPLKTEHGSVGNNIFAMHEDDDCADQLAILKEALNQRETGTLIFHEAAEEREQEYAYTYVPIESVDGWYMISIVPRAAIMQEADRVIKGTQTGIIFVVALVVFLCMFVMAARNYHRNFLEKEYKEEQFNLLANYLSNNTDDAYIMLEEGKKFIEYVTPNVERLWGISVSAGDILDDLQILRGDEELDRLDGMRDNESLPPQEMEWTNPQTGERKWLRVVVYCAYIQGKRKYIFYISDRTKDKKVKDDLAQALDSAEKANEAKSTFLSSISHDIRTPMNAIVGLITLLQQETDKPENVLEYAKKIDSSSQYLLGLINDILDMNKIESGKMTLTLGELNLAEFIEGIDSMIRPRTKLKEQTFVINTSCFKYENLIGDKTCVDQILINILSNAVKYTPEKGRIELTVSELPQTSKDFSRIQFRIRDNGQGMSEEYQKIIFDPFTRERNSMVNKIQGTGLGMAITKSLVDLMDGSISVESKLGEGSVFTVELNLQIQEEEDDFEFWKEHGVRRILVADDDKDVCENVVSVMSEKGVVADYVIDGEKVLRTLCEAKERGEPYDLVLLDWQMPDLSGMEVARLIRKDYPTKIPILLLTSYDWSDIEEEALEVGVNYFLSKPFFVSTFKEAIKRGSYKKYSDRETLSKPEDSIMQGKHILMVEDNKVNRFVLEKILASRGATYDVAEDGQEAVKMFEASAEGTYDFILMDVKMPVMDGYQATQAIRAGSHLSAERIPIIAMTANAFADDVVDALESGMDAHVAKPIILERLEKTIKDVLEKKKLLA